MPLITFDEDLDESENACKAHNDPGDPRSDDGAEAPDYDDDEEDGMLSSYVAVDDVTLHEAAELDAIALLAGTWNDDLDPEASAQMAQASAQAYFSFGNNKRKKGKSKGKCRGQYPVQPSHLSLEDRRRRLRELKAKTECRAFGRKGHWANDRECAMSSSISSTRNQTRTARMATRQQLTDGANQDGACCVFTEYNDDPDTSAYMVGQRAPLPAETIEQVPLTPTASAAVDTKDTATFNARVIHCIRQDRWARICWYVFRCV